VKLRLQKHIGFCLDWGHVRAFTQNDRIEDWIDFAHYLRNNGLQIYSHIHNNDGYADTHTPLHDAQKQGYDAPSIFCESFVSEMALKMNSQFPESHLISENAACFAKDNYLWLKEQQKFWEI